MHEAIAGDLEIKWIAMGHLIGKQISDKTSTLSKIIS